MNAPLQPAYDLIGDIHGHFGKLDALMGRLGYAHRGHGWKAPAGRQAVFVGDLIDRGPEQIAVYRAVRSMVDAGDAFCVMGNHELNAIAYITPRLDGSGRPIRGQYLHPRTPEKMVHHAEFLTQVTDGSALHREIVDWFRTLPLTLDLGSIRVVHAWWHQPYVDLVASRWAGGPMPDELLHEAHDKTTAVFAAVDGLCKGLEVRLPDGHNFLDHTGTERRDARVRWWHETPRTYKDVAIVDEPHDQSLPEIPLPDDYAARPVTGAPVFVGHYWMSGQPVAMSSKVACLDWSAARNGPLVAYRWDGETEIEEDKFVTSS